jgi:hypothetical protein
MVVNRWEERLTAGTSTARSGNTGSSRWGGSRDRWAPRRWRQCLGDHGEVECVVINLESSLQRRWRTTGVRWPVGGVLDMEECGKQREIWEAAILPRRSGWRDGLDGEAGRAGVLWFIGNSTSEILLRAVRSGRSRIPYSGAQSRMKPCQ